MQAFCLMSSRRSRMQRAWQEQHGSALVHSLEHARGDGIGRGNGCGNERLGIDDDYGWTIVMRKPNPHI